MPSSRSGQRTITKVTTCCELFKTAHFNCAKKLSMKIKKYYEFDPESYVNDASSPLLCVNCNKLWFHCGKKHIMANQVVVLVCVKCKAEWCYSSLKTKTKIMY